jgi:hypothetical protein
LTTQPSVSLPTFKCGTWFDPEVFSRLDAAIAKEESEKDQVADRCAYCDRAATTQGMCGPHFARYLRYGDALATGPAEPKHCDIPGCTDPHLARGKCAKHYSAWKRSRFTRFTEGHVGVQLCLWADPPNMAERYA